MSIVKKILLGLLLALLCLNYIPIKFAVDINEKEGVIEKTKERIVFVGDIGVFYKDNHTMSRANEKKQLLEYINDDSVYHSYNKYRYEINLLDNNKFSFQKIDILYPIKRTGFRGVFTPDSYLSIYDIDWLSFFRDTAH